MGSSAAHCYSYNMEQFRSTALVFWVSADSFGVNRDITTDARICDDQGRAYCEYTTPTILTRQKSSTQCLQGL